MQLFFPCRAWVAFPGQWTPPGPVSILPGVATQVACVFAYGHMRDAASLSAVRHPSICMQGLPCRRWRITEVLCVCVWTKDPCSRMRRRLNPPEKALGECPGLTLDPHSLEVKGSTYRVTWPLTPVPLHLISLGPDKWARLEECEGPPPCLCVPCSSSQTK